MAVHFRQLCALGLRNLTAEVPNGTIIGVIGPDGAGQRELLRLAAGLDQPLSGDLQTTQPCRLLGPADELNLEPVATLLLDQALAQHDALVRSRATIGLERLRRDGTAILLVSHDQEMLRGLCDELWWLEDGALAAQGDPGEVLDRYNQRVAERLQQWSRSESQPLAPSFRRGDGRAELTGLETLDGEGRPTMVWRSGEPATVRLRVRFHQAVADPVVGIMIRTRIGLEVYGTNTELEGLKLGPCQAGDAIAVTFSFRCDLCPQQYTLTAASHDPDGVWHDWLEDAIAFSVADSRYTAGVANLRARVTCSR